MFSHVVLGANDIPAAQKFYDAAMGALGHAPGQAMGDERVLYSGEGGLLMITRPIDGNPACLGNGSTIGLSAPGPEAVDAFHAAALAAGGSCAGEPGPRPAIPGSYAAYVRDPTGNKLVAWCVKAA
jgi:catechol 2,3-dioxygenase-like lactoylglutathione lyase family enzyme